MQRRSKGERLGWKSYAHLSDEQIQVELQKEFIEALKQELNKMDEYIIINKTALKKRLKEYKETPVTLGSRISELELILAQSTPLTPVVEDAYNAGKIHNDLSVAGFDNPQGRYVSNLKLEI